MSNHHYLSVRAADLARRVPTGGPLAWRGWYRWLAVVLMIPPLSQHAVADLPPIDLGGTNVTEIRTGRLNPATGSIDPLITRYWDLRPGDFPVVPWLSFSFAFSTEEIPREGQMFDAASFFIQDLNQVRASVLATVDGHGVAWLPPTEGTVSIPPSTQTHEAMEFPSLQPVMPIRFSHQVIVRLPQVYYPEPVRFVFQMFDYPNGFNSVAVVTAPQLFVVPEPTSLVMGGLGGVAIILIRRTWKKAAHVPR